MQRQGSWILARYGRHLGWIPLAAVAGAGVARAARAWQSPAQGYLTGEREQKLALWYIGRSFQEEGWCYGCVASQLDAPKVEHGWFPSNILAT